MGQSCPDVMVLGTHSQMHTLKCTLKIFYNNFGKQGQRVKIHGFFSEPFLFSNIMFFPQKGKAHLVILTNKL